ncbi:MAG: Type III pantothenate kinase [Verrucomicrobia subdivision 3 bacterium]|nr:Type III pantothenate kinase [Limisphaerales bacterium]MCS1416542.1 Type III pantothenate kinase [Limisphaerales bacterium]
MILSVDIGNTYTNVGIGDASQVLKSKQFRTSEWKSREVGVKLRLLVGRRMLLGSAVASVVPEVTETACRLIEKELAVRSLTLTHRNVVGIGIDYPRPGTIGPDRLANAMAATLRFGVPIVVVDFGTAVTFDVVDSKSCYVGGIIAPGLGAMTDYLHEKTALLPKIRIRDPQGTIGKSTREAMLIGAVKGYRGLVASLLDDLDRELSGSRLKVIATGGYAELMAKDLPHVQLVDQNLTLDGLRILGWECFGGA